MELKHTPGPWSVSRRDPARFQVATVELFGIYSRHPEGGDANCGAPENDARLVAAAPDLLDALLKLVAAGLDERTHHEFMSDPAHFARVAIAKATGDAHGSSD